ncbi:MAG: 1-deoxy-D-xylulose-5-phosphate synthase [Actinophytocola sp.]|uniref:1-deoxy-D-xylulose-5-phosphate synthase n=1 Tax=Actinophytocola sp. TaxID=1872138 RepID=UPI003C73B1F6
MDVAELVCVPFPRREINAGTPAVRQATIGWLTEQGLLTSRADVEEYDVMRLDVLTGLAYPRAGGDGLRLASDFTAWFFLFDDQFDGELGADPGRVRRVADRMLGRLSGDGPSAASHPLAEALADLWKRSIASRSDSWRRRMLASIEAYLRAFEQEAAFRRSARAPGISEYLVNRRQSIGIPVSLNLSESVLGYELASEVADHPLLHELIALTAEQVTLVNDLVSADKERAAGDINNSVLIHGLAVDGTDAEALRHVAGLIEVRHARFAEAAAALARVPGLAASVRRDTRRYVAAMQDWMHANLIWSMSTDRYRQSDQAPDLDRPWHGLIPAGIVPTIDRPDHVRAMRPHELVDLAGEVRAFLVDRVSRTGGHLGSNLGMVEISIALHRVFESPRDVILFDVGHQAYVHKILTGRQSGFAGLRQADGLSGYPSRAESVHDVIENSHASTALSYADGISRAFSLTGQDRAVVAVVGDGALTGGMCWEALNNIGADPRRRLVIVVNDNGRSYDPTVGAMARHLARLRQRRSVLDGSAPTEGNLFECLGVAYVGPVDGHDVHAVEAALRKAKGSDTVTLVHCVTTKGRGYRPAEADPVDRLHGIPVTDPATGIPMTRPAPSWTSVFADELATLGASHPELVCITAAMLRPVGFEPFATRFPGRVIDVGMAEQHAVASAAGLAFAGLHPVVAVYATFLNRAFDQLLLDVALHRAPVTFVLDRAGVTGEDGASHHGMWDLALSGLVPGLRVAAPRDPHRLRELLREAVSEDSPALLRYPKATAGADIDHRERRDGLDLLTEATAKDVLVVSVGPTAGAVLAATTALAADGIAATVVDPRWVLPVAPALVELARPYRAVLVVEDGLRHGGVGGAVAAALADANVGARVHVLGLPTRFLAHGRRDDILHTHRLDAAAIGRTIKELVPHG